ncbi:phosphatase and actin regulator 1-like isoform X2 [Anneissia japonica]|uniref:phosphatase and actin regulator 1-like isoform X2 n=1 Tax=Anneissia japonica TaxID=1529436 RepID=UPI001425B9E7|nr:phosphatase and actin regulator 1-like isoform X2 [Anneissia japonica]
MRNKFSISGSLHQRRKKSRKDKQIVNNSLHWSAVGNGSRTMVDDGEVAGTQQFEATSPQVTHTKKKSRWSVILKPWKWRKRKSQKKKSKKEAAAAATEAAKSEKEKLMPEEKVEQTEGIAEKEDDKIQTPEDSSGEDGQKAVTTQVEINHMSTEKENPDEQGGDDSEAESTPPEKPPLDPSFKGVKQNSPPPLPEKKGAEDHTGSSLKPVLPPKKGGAKSSPVLPTNMNKSTDSPPLPPKTGKAFQNGNLSFNMETPNKGIGFTGEKVITPAATCNGDIHNNDSDLSDYENNRNSDRDDDSDTDDESYNKSFAAKVKRNDSLAFKLSNRPEKKALLERNIIQDSDEKDFKARRENVGTALVRRLSQRPSKEELQERNIYRVPKSDEQKQKEKEETKTKLVRKLSFRPTVEELRRRNIIGFQEYVEVVDAAEYDRRADKPWTKLTPQDKAMIRKELNDFKSEEMAVHEESRKFTRFHRP